MEDLDSKGDSEGMLLSVSICAPSSSSSTASASPSDLSSISPPTFSAASINSLHNGCVPPATLDPAASTSSRTHHSDDSLCVVKGPSSSPPSNGTTTHKSSSGSHPSLSKNSASTGPLTQQNNYNDLLASPLAQKSRGGSSHNSASVLSTPPPHSQSPSKASSVTTSPFASITRLFKHSAVPEPNSPTQSQPQSNGPTSTASTASEFAGSPRNSTATNSASAPVSAGPSASTSPVFQSPVLSSSSKFLNFFRRTSASPHPHSHSHSQHQHHPQPPAPLLSPPSGISRLSNEGPTSPYSHSHSSTGSSGSEVFSSPSSSSSTSSVVHRQSYSFRFKKYMASKAASTSLGRAAIRAFLGDTGNALLDTLQHMTEKDRGKEAADELIIIILKLALKGKILHDERLITKKELWLMGDSVNSLALKMYDSLKQRDFEEEKKRRLRELERERQKQLELEQMKLDREKRLEREKKEREKRKKMLEEKKERDRKTRASLNNNVNAALPPAAATSYLLPGATAMSAFAQSFYASAGVPFQQTPPNSVSAPVTATAATAASAISVSATIRSSASASNMKKTSGGSKTPMEELKSTSSVLSSSASSASASSPSSPAPVHAASASMSTTSLVASNSNLASIEPGRRSSSAAQSSAAVQPSPSSASASLSAHTSPPSLTASTTVHDCSASVSSSPSASVAISSSASATPSAVSTSSSSVPSSSPTSIPAIDPSSIHIPLTASGRVYVDPAHLVSDFAVLAAQIISLFHGHISEKNLVNLTDALQYIGSAHFLNKLLNDDEYLEEKRMCLNLMRKLTTPLLKKRKYDEDMRQICKRTGCKEFVVEKWGKFRGSGNCFTADTLITLADGSSTCIRDLRLNNYQLPVAACDMNGRVSSHYQTNWLYQGKKKCIQLTFEDGRTISCTPDHRFMVRCSNPVTYPQTAAASIDSNVWAVLLYHGDALSLEQPLTAESITLYSSEQNLFSVYLKQRNAASSSPAFRSSLGELSFNEDSDNIEVRVNNMLITWRQSVVLQHGDMVRITDVSVPNCRTLRAIQFFYPGEAYHPYVWTAAQHLKLDSDDVVCSLDSSKIPLHFNEPSTPTATLKVVRVEDLEEEQDVYDISVAGLHSFFANGIVAHNCYIHHDEEFRQLMEHPSVAHFLTGDGRSYYPFQEAVKKKVDRHIRRLYLVLVAYRSAPMGLRTVYAEEIYKKYLKTFASHYVHVKTEHVAEIEKKINERKKIEKEEEAEREKEREKRRAAGNSSSENDANNSSAASGGKDEKRDLEDESNWDIQHGLTLSVSAGDALSFPGVSSSSSSAFSSALSSASVSSLASMMTLFDDVLGSLHVRLHEYFFHQFRFTSDFHEYVAQYRLPTYLQKELQEAKRRKAKEDKRLKKTLKTVQAAQVNGAARKAKERVRDKENGAEEEKKEEKQHNEENAFEKEKRQGEEEDGEEADDGDEDEEEEEIDEDEEEEKEMKMKEKETREFPFTLTEQERMEDEDKN